MSPIALQLLTALAAGVIGAAARHFWPASGSGSAAGAPSIPALFPNHPIASKALTDILSAAESAALAAARGVFNAQLPLPAATAGTDAAPAATNP